MRNREKLTFTMAALMVVVVGLSVAYAALSSTFTITSNNVTVPSASWGVGFPNSNACTVAATGSATCGSATAGSGSVTVGATSLKLPGDTCKYTCTINNSGSVNAKLTSVSATAPTSSPTTATCAVSGSTITCKNSSSTDLVKYQLGSNSACTTALSNNTINAGSSLTVYLCITYVPTNAVQSSAYTFTNAKYSLTFGQN